MVQLVLYDWGRMESQWVPSALFIKKVAVKSGSVVDHTVQCLEAVDRHDKMKSIIRKRGEEARRNPVDIILSLSFELMLGLGA